MFAASIISTWMTVGLQQRVHCGWFAHLRNDGTSIIGCRSSYCCTGTQIDDCGKVEQAAKDAGFQCEAGTAWTKMDKLLWLTRICGQIVLLDQLNCWEPTFWNKWRECHWHMTHCEPIPPCIIAYVRICVVIVTVRIFGIYAFWTLKNISLSSSLCRPQ